MILAFLMANINSHNGVIRIKAGRTRVVILFGQWAIKIPGRMFFYGIKANRREASYPKDDRVCPVIASYLNAFIIIMPRADRLASWEEWENLNYLDWCDVTSDIFPHNLGLFDGVMKVIDYGKADGEPSPSIVQRKIQKQLQKQTLKRRTL